MTALANLGWAMARCSIDRDSAELVICDPASEGEPANSISILGLDAVIALRDCIDEEIANLQARIDIEDLVKDS